SCSAGGDQFYAAQQVDVIFYEPNHFRFFAVMRNECYRFLFHYVDLLRLRNRQGLFGCSLSFSLINVSTSWLIRSLFSLTIWSPNATSFWILAWSAASSSSRMLCRLLGSMRVYWPAFPADLYN